MSIPVRSTNVEHEMFEGRSPRLGDLRQTSGSMADFEVGQTPALDTHVLGHHGETLGLDLPDMISSQGVWRPHPAALCTVEEGRKHEPVPMPVGANWRDGRHRPSGSTMRRRQPLRSTRARAHTWGEHSRAYRLVGHSTVLYCHS